MFYLTTLTQKRRHAAGPRLYAPDNMSELYKILEVTGKGLGAIATKDIKKGTLILKENRQLVAKSNVPNTSTDEYVRNIIRGFNQMSQLDQEEYLKLHDGVDLNFGIHKEK